MDSVLQSDIFFFISSISVIFITIALLVAIMYVIWILRDIRSFISSVRQGTDALAEDLSEIRSKLTNKGVWMGFVLSIINAASGISQKMHRGKRSKKKKVE